MNGWAKYHYVRIQSMTGHQRMAERKMESEKETVIKSVIKA